MHRGMTISMALPNPFQILQLLILLAFGVPLTGLQAQDADQDQGQDGITGGDDSQRVLSGDDRFALDDIVRHRIGAGADHAQTLDDVGDVDGDGAHVEKQAGAVEQRVGLGRPVQLDEEAQQAHGDDDVEDARHDRRGPVQLPQVRLHVVVPLRAGRSRCPEDRVVVGELGEENAQEEGRC